MSRKDKQLKPTKTLRLLADGKLADPNSGRTFATSAAAAAFWKEQHDIHIKVELNQFDEIRPPEKGDPIQDENGLWSALKCGPMAFQDKRTAAAYGKWILTGGHRTAVKGKPFADTLDDIFKVALLADAADTDRANAASRIGIALVSFLEAVPWINPRLDVIMTLSSEFTQAAIYLSLPNIPTVRLRVSYQTGGFEALSDSLTFDSDGPVYNPQDELGVVSLLAAHVKTNAIPNAFFHRIVNEPFDVEVIGLTKRLCFNNEIIINPRKTAFLKLATGPSDPPKHWDYLSNTRAVTDWKKFEVTHIKEK